MYYSFDNCSSLQNGYIYSIINTSSVNIDRIVVILVCFLSVYVIILSGSWLWIGESLINQSWNLLIVYLLFLPLYNLFSFKNSVDKQEMLLKQQDLRLRPSFIGKMFYMLFQFCQNVLQFLLYIKTWNKCPGFEGPFNPFAARLVFTSDTIFDPHQFSPRD